MSPCEQTEDELLTADTPTPAPTESSSASSSLGTVFIILGSVVGGGLVFALLFHAYKKRKTPDDKDTHIDVFNSAQPAPESATLYAPTNIKF